MNPIEDLHIPARENRPDEPIRRRTKRRRVDDDDDVPIRRKRADAGSEAVRGALTLGGLSAAVAIPVSLFSSQYMPVFGSWINYYCAAV